MDNSRAMWLFKCIGQCGQPIKAIAANWWHYHGEFIPHMTKPKTNTLY